MTKSESFNKIVSNFRNEVVVFLKENNLDKYSIQVHLKTQYIFFISFENNIKIPSIRWKAIKIFIGVVL